MKLAQEGIDLIKRREACRLKAYLCPAKVWTVGYGHTGPEVHQGLTISQDEAEALLLADLIVFDSAVLKACPDATPLQHAAMVSLCYNIGTGAFAKSSVARLHNAGKYAEAAQAFALWNKGGGKVLAGLVSRRAEESGLYLKGAPEETFETEIDAPAATAQGEKGLHQSRSMNGQALAGIGAIATAAPAVVPPDAISGLREAFDMLTPVAPYAVYGSALLVVIGIGLTIFARWHDRHEGRA